MEFRGVLERDAGDPHALAVGEPDQMGPERLLRLGGRGDIGIMVQAEGVPELAVFRDRPAHAPVGRPLDVADLAALDGAPPFAVAVDDAFAGDTHVFPLAGRDGGDHALAVLLEEQGLVRRKEDQGAALQVEVGPVFQHERARQPDSGRDDQVAAARLRQGVDGLPESVRIQCNAVSDAAEVLDGYGFIRDDRGFRLREGKRQVPVVLRPVAGPRGEREQDEKQEDRFFHRSNFLDAKILFFIFVPADRDKTR